jgi:hypothetical protein
MKTTNQKAVLMERIIELQHKQAHELQLLKDQYQTTIDSFKPLNLIKTSLQEIASTPNLTSKVIGGTLGFGTNYLLKTFLNENDPNPIKKIVGKLVKMTIKRFVGRK